MSIGADQQSAREQFEEAMKTAPGVGWLARLAKAQSTHEAAEAVSVDEDAIVQVERLEASLLAWDRQATEHLSCDL